MVRKDRLETLSLGLPEGEVFLGPEEDPVGLAAGDAQSGGASPVLTYHYEVTQIEVLDNAFECVAMGCRREVEPGRRLGQAEAGQIDGNTPELVTQQRHHLPVHERPRRIPVTQQQRTAAAFIDVVKTPVLARFKPAMLKRIEGVGNLELHVGLQRR